MYAIIQTSGHQIRSLPAATRPFPARWPSPGATGDARPGAARRKGQRRDHRRRAVRRQRQALSAVVEGESARPEDPRVQEEAPEGPCATTKGHRAVLHARARHGHSDVAIGPTSGVSTGFRQWLIKRTRQLTQRPRFQFAAPRREGARRQPRHRRHDHRPPARAAVPSRASTPASARTTRFSPRSPGRVRFEDHGARGRVISILPVE